MTKQYKDIQDRIKGNKPLSPNLLNSNSDARVKTNLRIFFTILKNAPINIYQLHLKLGKVPSYTQVKRTLKEMEFCGLIQFRVILNEQNRAEKQIIIPENVLKEAAEKNE